MTTRFSPAAGLAIAALCLAAPAWAIPLDVDHFSYSAVFARDCSARPCGPTTFPPIVEHVESFTFGPALTSATLSDPFGVVGGNATTASAASRGASGIGVFSNATSRVSAATSTLQRYTYLGTTPILGGATIGLDYLQLGANLDFNGVDANPGASGSVLDGSVWIFGYTPGLLPIETAAGAPAGRCALDLDSGVAKPFALFDCLPTLPGFSLLDEAELVTDGSGFQSTEVSFGISPGDSFYVLTWVQAVARLGGQLDARHTFEFNFDNPELYEVTPTAVPEPTALSLLCVAFACFLLVQRRPRARSV